MTQIHTSYKVSKMLKEFLGESAPEPMAIAFWKMMILATDTPGPVFHERGSWYNGKLDCWSYQLHDLLSKPFCEAMAKTDQARVENCLALTLGYVHETLSHEYSKGGMEAVEKALIEMMEGK